MTKYRSCGARIIVRKSVAKTFGYNCKPKIEISWKTVPPTISFEPVGFWAKILEEDEDGMTDASLCCMIYEEVKSP